MNPVGQLSEKARACLESVALKQLGGGDTVRLPQLAVELGMTLPELFRVNDELVEAGLCAIERLGGGNNPLGAECSYRLAADPLDVLAAFIDLVNPNLDSEGNFVRDPALE